MQINNMFSSNPNYEQELSGYLEKTLSPDPSVRRPAEKYLEQMETQANFGPALLVLCNKPERPVHLRVCSAVTFKNYVKRNWRVSDDVVGENGDKISAGDREWIKRNIVELMLTSPEQIQLQLSDAISIISKEDFPGKWNDLLPSLVERLKTGDFQVANGVLRTAHSIFKRFIYNNKTYLIKLFVKAFLPFF